MTYLQALFLGLLQGVSELFPISSLGHTVIVPSIVHMKIDQHDPSFLFFIVATHFATALVLLGFFWRDWLNIIIGILRSLYLREIRTDDPEAKIGWLLIVSTIPAGLLGLLFEDKLKLLFTTPFYAALFLIMNGFLLFGAENLRKLRSNHSITEGDPRLARLTWLQALSIGAMQCLALLPGFSRTGATLSGGLLVGLSHGDAARYSFLLATPIIFAAAILKIPQLAMSANISTIIGPILVGVISSAIGAYVSVRFLTKYFHTQTLTPFAIYCVLGGGLALLLI